MSSLGRVHIVGAGMAGLAAAVTLIAGGHRVALYESGQHAGGRCRSFLDPELGCRVDNGNHLLLAGNTAALAYIERIGALDTFERPPETAIPFIDLGTGERWELRPNRGPVPWWLLDAVRRVPDTRPGDYLEALKLRRADANATVAAVLDPKSLLFRRLWQPLAVAALNTGVEQGSARLFWRVLAETLGRGGAACRELAALALGHFDEAARAMAHCSRRAMRPAAVMGAFYRALLDALLREGWRDPSSRVSLSKLHKLRLVLRHGLV